MKLYNVIVNFDMYVVAESPEAAREALTAWVAEGNEPSEVVAIEAARENSVRTAWRDKPPLVAADVTDTQFETLKGRTTATPYTLLYTKDR